MRCRLIVACVVLGSCRWIAAYDPGSAAAVAPVDSARPSDGPADVPVTNNGSWIEGFRIEGPPTLLDIAITTDGEIGLVGSLGERVTAVDGRAWKSAGQDDALILRANSSGKVRWVRIFGSTGFDEARGVAAVGSALVVAGYFQETVDFGIEQKTGGAPSNAFALRLNDAGIAEWVYAPTDAYHAIGSSIGVHSADEVTLVGSYTSTATFMGGQQSSVSNSQDWFWVRIDGSGDPLAAGGIGGSEKELATAILPLPNGAWVIGGQFRGQINFGGGPRTATEGDGVLVATDADGGYLWDTVISGDGNNSVNALWLAGEQIVVRANCIHELAINAETPLGCQNGGALLIWLDSSGKYLRHLDLAAGSDSPITVGEQQLKVIRTFWQPTDFGGGEHVPNDVDTAIVTFDLDGTYQKDLIIGGINDQKVSEAVVDDEGALIVAGTFINELSIPALGGIEEQSGIFIARIAQ